MPYQNWIDAQRVCVIGAGTMGSGIAAHLANIGFEVTLLDLTKDSVATAFDRAKNSKPPHFYVPETANKIRVGSIADNLDWVAKSDWVCEAIIERLPAKRELFAKVEPLLKPDAMITTNTSGLQIGLLAEGLSDTFRKRFIGTHFFNPPRYLKLMELIPTDETDPEAIKAISAFLEKRCARRVVTAKDTPGFIANRYGMWAMFHAIHTAERLSLTLEQVDAITGTFLGRPRSASFRLNDIVGLDVMQDIASNLIQRCDHDPHRNVLETPKSMKFLLEKGWIGEKAGQGYYRREGREFLALDLNTFAYRQRRDTNFESLDALAKMPLGERVGAALALKDEAGEYLRNHLIPVLAYAESIKEEISHSHQDFDRVMKWGFAWEKGPFEMIDAIGPEKLGFAPKKYYAVGQQLDFKGGMIDLPKEPDYLTLADFAVASKHETFQVRDMGDGVKAICLTTKQGTINPGLVNELTRYLEESKDIRFVLGNEGKNFSLGYDLNFFLNAINNVDVAGIENALSSLHRLGELLEKKCVVAAIQGYCLGAGLEIALSCSVIAATAEAQIGLPESKVGLIPGGRGTVLARLNAGSHVKDIADTALQLTEGIVGVTAEHARQLGYVREGDHIVYHPDRLYHDAKELAMKAEPLLRPAWKSVGGPLVGMIDKHLSNAKAAGRLTEYDETIGQKIKSVFAKAHTYEEALERERVEFAELCFKALTQARIKHMLDSGKPLKN